MNMLYARNEHQGILITCPLCKMSVRHDAETIGNAIKDAKPIVCVVCECRFLLSVSVVSGKAVEQPLAPDEDFFCECEMITDNMIIGTSPICPACRRPRR